MSECMAREVHTFCPVIRYESPSRTARVFNCVVSDPVVGSVTPNACKRMRPAAISGKYFRFCASLPCRNSVPIMYICACP